MLCHSHMTQEGGEGLQVGLNIEIYINWRS